MNIECAQCGRVMNTRAVVSGRTGVAECHDRAEKLAQGFELDVIAFDAGEEWDLCSNCLMWSYPVYMLSNGCVDGFDGMWMEGL